MNHVGNENFCRGQTQMNTRESTVSRRRKFTVKSAGPKNLVYNNLRKFPLIRGQTAFSELSRNAKQGTENTTLVLHWVVLQTFMLRDLSLNFPSSSFSGSCLQKKPRIAPGLLEWLSVIFLRNLLDLGDVRSLKTLGTLDDFEGYLVAFVQGLETVALDRRKMHKHILAVLLRDETKPLAVVEPLHYTICHSDSPLLLF